MDTRLYKKKAFAFTNNEVSRNLRHAETLKARESSRFKRLSMLRNLDEEVNEDKSTEIMKREEKKKPPSRLEMLSKWKKEKQIKNELDKKKKPFYVGGQFGKSNSNMGLSSVAQPNVGLHSSRIAKSRLAPPSSIHSAKIINTTKQNVGKIANVTRSNGVLSKNSKTTSGSTAVSSATQGSIPRIAQSTKVLGAKTAPNARNVIKTTTKPLAVKSQVSALPKPTFTKQPNKPVLKTGIPSFSSNSLKGNSAQKMKNQVAPHLTENVSNKKKENCFKIAPSKLPGMKNEASNSGLQKKGEEKNKNIKMHKEELVPELCLENASSVFDCDISIISHTASFAPSNFQFVPPAGLSDIFHDDDTFERIKAKCISRTSTPSKECKKSSSPVAEVVCKDSSLIDNVKDISKDSLLEEKLPKETGVNLPSVTENKMNDPNEQTNSPILLDEPIDFLLKVDLNKIRKLVEEHKRLEEEDEKSNSGNSLLNESKNKEHAYDDVSIDSPLNIIDLSDSDDIYTKPVESLKLDDEPISDMDKVLSEKESNQSTKVSDVCVDSPLQIIDLNKVEKISTNNELEVLQQEELINDELINKKENSQRTKVSKDAHVDSPIKLIDLSKNEKKYANNELEVLEEEELMNDDLYNQQDQDKYIKKKLGVHPTRVSMLKNVPVLNSIAEIAEPESCSTQTPDAYSTDKQTVTPPRHSQRLQQSVTVEENPSCTSALTPRRSLRLQNIGVRKSKCQFEELILSPKPKNNLRRSMRLIDLNTPEKEIANSPVSKTNITADFERLTLMEPENINPHACLLDFDCSPVPRAKSKKISLLYSPEKVRKSMRKSIRGDLMSFSPSH